VRFPFGGICQFETAVGFGFGNPFDVRAQVLVAHVFEDFTRTIAAKDQFQIIEDAPAFERTCNFWMDFVAQPQRAGEIPHHQKGRHEQHGVKQNQRAEFTLVMQRRPQGDNPSDGMTNPNGWSQPARCQKLQQVIREGMPVVNFLHF